MPRACNSGCICSAVIRTCIGEGGCIFSHQSMHSGCVNVWGEEERRPWPAAEDAVAVIRACTGEGGVTPRSHGRGCIRSHLGKCRAVTVVGA